MPEMSTAEPPQALCTTPLPTIITTTTRCHLRRHRHHPLPPPILISVTAQCSSCTHRYAWMWCAPTRGSLLSGRFPMHTGYTGGGFNMSKCSPHRVYLLRSLLCVHLLFAHCMATLVDEIPTPFFAHWPHWLMRYQPQSLLDSVTWHLHDLVFTSAHSLVLTLPAQVGACRATAREWILPCHCFRSS
jgi:hypothetical protein